MNKSLTLAFLICVHSVNVLASQELYNAIESGNLQSVQKSLGNQHPDKILIGNQQKTYPIIFASKHGHINMVKWLLKEGANVNIHDKQGGYPLFFALTQDNLVLAELLLKNKASTTPAKSNKGEKPALFWAVESDNPEMVKLLIKYGANPNVRFYDMSLLEFAEEEAGDEVINLIK